MYEGKNIHFSQTADQKRLCSFSGKICNQRRLNHYGFCVRHILEDPMAPFKRCAFVAKSSGHTCTQPIPKTEDRVYCNNHMQVLGMLPKKERKVKKEKDRHGSLSTPFYFEGAKADPGLLQNKVRPRPGFGSMKSKLMISKPAVGGEEMDDVYAFPTDSSENKIRELTAVFSSVTAPNITIPVSSTNTVANTGTKTQSDSGQSSLAKIYPELAEKLEKIKPKVEVKTKGKVKNSRTMNSLQTKIAQNKIKDKLKRNQCSSNTSSQSQSPSHSHTSSPGYQINSSSPNHPAQSATSPIISVPPNVTVMRDGLNSVVGLSASSGAASTVNAAPSQSLSQLNLLNGLNLQTLNLSLEQLGVRVPTVSDIEQTLKQLASAANIPLEGSTLGNKEPTLATAVAEPQTGHILPPAPGLQHLLPQTFTLQSKPPPPYSSVHHKPFTELLKTSAVSNASSTVTMTEQLNKPALMKDVVTGHQIRPVAASVPSIPLTSQIASVPFVTRQHLSTAPQSGAKIVPTSSAAFSSPSSSSLPKSLTSSLGGAFPQHPKLTLLTSSQTDTSPTKLIESVKQNQTAPVFQPPKPKSAKSRPRSRNPSSTTKRPVTLMSFPMTLVKPRKIRKLLDDEEVKKLKTKSAIEYYKNNKEKKMDHHYMVFSSVASSDESDLSDCDMLPWQQDWFHASSEEEADEDDSDSALRTAKLALGRARLRRQCSQAKSSSRLFHDNDITTSSLISAARESARSAVKCLQEINCIKTKSPVRLKSKGLVKRRCLYKDNEEVQCKNNVVPYTNHCIKHVMYNVDQQLFEYCTAKFADNTQCCHPVIDVKHELPLCMEHGVKADNFLKTQDLEPKPKRPRKKTKPSALTRPPKKGKKKKNQRKNFRPEKPSPADVETPESETDDVNSQSHTEMNVDSDSDKAEPLSSATNGQEIEKPSLPEPSVKTSEYSTNIPPPPSSLVVKDGVKLGTNIQKTRKSGSASQLEELDNLTSLSELDNVKMFGDLETTASKLLEENDFQEVFNKLPDVAFDIFNSKTSGLPGTDELQDFEDSLALANRELKMPKETQESISTSTSKTPAMRRELVQTQVPVISQTPVNKLSQSQSTVAPILEESDDFTRQIAEEIMKQNIGPSASIRESLCNGDAEESIKAIARSLSNSGMMLAAEAKHNVQSPEVFVSNQSSQSLSRAQSLPVYSNLDSMYYPPNIAIQNVQASSVAQSVSDLVPTAVLSKGPVQNQQGQVSFTGPTSTNAVPQNVTVTPQGIITSHFGTARLAPSTQTVTIGNTTVTGNQTAGIITLPVAQQLTAQQLSALVQQATAQLPPLPPYTPRQPAQAPVTTPQPAQLVSVPSTRPLSQEQLIQHLAKQQEQLGEQQQLLAQQILQQRLAVLRQQAMPVKVTLPTTQNLGFSTILHQGPAAQLGRLNQGALHAIPNVKQIAPMIKTTLPTSQKASAAAASTSLPSTNIVWTSPPNVTITSPNGLPRSVAQTFISGSKVTPSLPTSKTSTIKETFIDLTESNDPPPYEAAISSQGKTLPPPSYPAGTTPITTSVTGKS